MNVYEVKYKGASYDGDYVVALDYAEAEEIVKKSYESPPTIQSIILIGKDVLMKVVDTNYVDYVKLTKKEFDDLVYKNGVKVDKEGV